MSTIAKAYVQIIPSTEGVTDKIKESLSGSSSSFESIGEEYGNTIGSKITSTIAKMGIGVAIGKTIADSVKNAASYEQLTGGVETLFKESSAQVVEYAQQAYRTAGLSSNQYMEQITSFSASLISSLGGDTAKAAEVGNRAIIDMADNANKMGTPIESIQNAYQGFAKQNYTMLDNLKLGYGGTKTEMERLISDASKMTDVQSKLNVKVNEGDMSFSNIVNAISVMQESMGIAGATAEEAGSTIEGSFNMMKAAWENLKTAIGTGLNVDQAASDFVSSVQAVVENIAPIIVRVGPTLIQAFSSIIVELTPVIMDGIGEVFTAAFQQIPTIFANMNPIGKIVTLVVGGFMAIKAAGDFSSAISSSIDLAKSIMKIVKAKTSAAAAAAAAATAETADAGAKVADAGATTMLGTASMAAAPGIWSVAAVIVAVALAVAAVAIAIVALTGNLDDLTNAFSALGSSVNGAGTSMNSLNSGLSSSAGQMAALQGATSGVANNINSMGGNLGGMSSDLNGIASSASSAANSFNSLGSSTSSARSSMNDIQLSWSDLKGAMSRDSGSIVREFQGVEDSWDEFNGYVKNSNHAMTNLYHSLTDEAREAMRESEKILYESGSGSADAFKEGWSGKRPELESAMEDVIRNHVAMGEIHHEWWENGVKAGNNYEKGGTQAFKDAQSSYMDSVKLLAGSAYAGWETSSGDIEEAVKATMEATGKDAKAAARDYETIGKFMSAGIVEGWKNGKASKEIADEIRRIINESKDAAGVHSPSVYFKEIGQYMVEGLEIGLSGIDDVYNNVINSTKNLVKNGLNEAANVNVELLNNYVGTRNRVPADDSKIEKLASALTNLKVNTNVTLEGDAGKLFTAMQNQNRVYRNSTGRSAFA